MQIAVLIDAENINYSFMDELFEWLEGRGNIVVKRAFADWRNLNKVKWVTELNRHAITSVQQFNLVKGKGSADTAIIVDAMDMMYQRDIDAFVIVSSDSDFSSLAVRLRNAGKEVWGFGREVTPQAFRDACTTFYEVQSSQEEVAQTSMLAEIIANQSKHDGWALMSHVGSTLLAKGFDFQSLGFTKLSEYVSSQDQFELEYFDGAWHCRQKTIG